MKISPPQTVAACPLRAWSKGWVKLTQRKSQKLCSSVIICEILQSHIRPNDLNLNIIKWNRMWHVVMLFFHHPLGAYHFIPKFCFRIFRTYLQTSDFVEYRSTLSRFVLMSLSPPIEYRTFSLTTRVKLLLCSIMSASLSQPSRAGSYLWKSGHW